MLQALSLEHLCIPHSDQNMNTNLFLMVVVLFTVQAKSTIFKTYVW